MLAKLAWMLENDASIFRMVSLKISFVALVRN